MKDYASIECHCGHREAKPYPSLQKNPPQAPTLEELKNIDEAVLNAFCIHQNQKHCNLNKGSPNAY